MYNTAKLPSTVILPSNNNVNYHYDVLNRPTSTSINTANPITAQYTYTGTARGSSLYTTNLISTEVTNAFAYSYTYDRNGNITSIQNGIKQSDGSYTYSTSSGNKYIYDRYNQLKRDVDYDNATATYYSHDSNGNIAEKTVRSWDLQNNCPTAVIESNTYTYADNKGWGDLLTAYNGQTITYDAIGNPLNYRDGITMTWQNGRELATFKKGTVDVSYTYDTGSLRTSKSVVEDFVSTEYNYVYENGLLRQMTYGNHVYNISYDAYGTPVLLNHIIPTSGLNEYYYYGVNSRGDVEALYYSDGSLYATYDYDAYGKLLGITSAYGSDLTGTNTVANNNPLRYRSYVYDTETGFYYLQSRYYDPTTCRFVNADVYYETGQGINGYNMFAYCNNNPIDSFDFTGDRYAKCCSSGNCPDCKAEKKRTPVSTPSVSTTPAPTNTEPSFFEKCGQSLDVIYNSVYIEVGAGYGIGGSIGSGNLSANGTINSDLVHAKFSSDGVEFGMDCNISFGPNINGYDIPPFTYNYNYNESYITQQYSEYEGFTDDFIIIDVSTYIIVGYTFIGGWDGQKISDGLSNIW